MTSPSGSEARVPIRIVARRGPHAPQAAGRGADVARSTAAPATRGHARRPTPSETAMPHAPDLLAQLRSINGKAAFNRWCELEVVTASPGQVEIAMPWREEAGQYAGFLHAGLVAALIDTACGYAAATLVGPSVLAAHFSVKLPAARRGPALHGAGPGGQARQDPGVHRVRAVCPRRRPGQAGGHGRDAAHGRPGIDGGLRHHVASGRRLTGPAAAPIDGQPRAAGPGTMKPRAFRTCALPLPGASTSSPGARPWRRSSGAERRVQPFGSHPSLPFPPRAPETP